MSRPAAERKNVIGANAGEAQVLTGYLERYRDDPAAVAVDRETLDETAKERLRALGYDPD